jgi:membrane protein YdbS with pleckstrin-like domain
MAPGDEPGPARVIAEDFPQLDASQRALRALRVLLFSMNAAVGVFTALLVYSLTDGMPVWILVAVALVCAVGAALGAVLAPRLARWIGLPTALSGAALLTGEAMTGGGLLVNPQRPVATLILFCVALLTFAVCQRLSRAARRRLVPAEQLKRVTRKFRWIGFAGFLAGAVVAGIFFAFVAANRRLFRELNYVEIALAAGGVLIVLTALLTIPAIRVVRTPNDKRRPVLALAAPAVVIPVIVAVMLGIGYVSRLNDFTAAPDICTSSNLAADRIEEILGGSPEKDGDDGEHYVTCSWTHLDDDSSKELEVDVDVYDDGRSAGRVLERHRKLAADDGKTLAELQLGDESIRRGYAGYIESHDSTGLSVEVRIENLVLEVSLDHGEALGSPDPAQLEALADELSQEIKSRQPNR